MYFYSFGGIRLLCPVPVAGLCAGAGFPDNGCVEIAFERGRPPTPERVLFRWQGRYGMAVSAFGPHWLFTSTRSGAFLLSRDGFSIRWWLDGTDDLTALPGSASFLVRRVLPRLAQLHGRLVLHAAAISLLEGVILLVGVSGTGKSTLSAALNLQFGWSTLSDDIAVLDEQCDPPRCFPTGLGVCLWSDSVSALAIGKDRCELLPGYDGKYWHDADSRASDGQPRPVRAVCYLTGGPEQPGDSAARVERVALPRGFALTARHIVCLDPTDRVLTHRSLVAVSKLAETVPMYSLSYSKGYESFGAVDGALRELAGVGSPGNQ